ncbi:winged helix-turn-helix domain-containing tetratricopeptide repeat protein [Loktanella agnita]|uniref:winged helix-turn-helix domain-containing tetratricopeptide repeat protein n=1 Tax=Loktanella agnita TaxID=287097 RepID=UPI00398A076D
MNITAPEIFLRHSSSDHQQLRLFGVNSDFFVEYPRNILNAELVSAEADRGSEFSVRAETKIEKAVALGLAHYLPEQDQLCGADGERIFLRAQSARVLRYMARRLGVLVTRDELIDEVWRDLSVTDDSLTQCISDVRRAIGDKKRVILKTIPKRGFILYGEPRADDPAPAPHAALQLQKTRHADPADLSQEEVVAYVRDPNGALDMDIHAQNSDGHTQTVDSHGAVVQKLRFPSVAAAVDACLPLVRHPDVAAAIDTSGAAWRGLLDAARSGDILASVDARDLAQSYPQLHFEDLGQAGDQNITRAFRLSRNGRGGDAVMRLSDQTLLPTISVLPLQNINQDGSDILGSVFADIMTAALGSSEEINVTSRLSTAAFGSGNASLMEIGRRLSAEFVLSGFFARRDDTLQINLEFAEVANQRMLWAHRLTVPVDELLGDFEPAYEIMSRIRQSILISEIRRANTTPLSDMQNYSLMFASVGLMHRFSPSNFARAHDMLGVLSERMPNHPVPLAWTARWHLLRVVQGWSENPDADARAALGCTGRALDLDPENVLALACEGHVLTNLLHRLDDAEDRYDLALQINPNDANARSLRGMMLGFQDRGKEGVRDTERALHLSPLDPHRFFYLAMAAGAWLTPEDNGYEKAEHYAKASLRLNRGHTSSLRMLAVAQQLSGKVEAARETVAELMQLQPDLRVSNWLKSSPSADYNTGRVFAQAMRDAGVPR